MIGADTNLSMGYRLDVLNGLAFHKVLTMCFISNLIEFRLVTYDQKRREERLSSGGVALSWLCP